MKDLITTTDLPDTPEKKARTLFKYNYEYLKLVRNDKELSAQELATIEGIERQVKALLEDMSREDYEECATHILVFEGLKYTIPSASFREKMAHGNS